jgi:hypothetical protein
MESKIKIRANRLAVKVLVQRHYEEYEAIYKNKIKILKKLEDGSH